MQLIVKTYLLLILTFTLSKSYGQIYNIKNYNTSDGLAQSQVLAIFQDSKGYMYYGTNSGGVSKYDGNTFTTLNVNSGLANDVVFSVVESDKNEIIFGTANGLSVYNSKKITNYYSGQGLKNTVVFKLLQDKNKTWIGTQEGVFILSNGKIEQFKLDTVLNKSSIWSMHIDAADNIWFGTLGNGAVLFNRQKNKFQYFNEKNGLTNNNIYSIGEKTNGDILLGTQFGLNAVSKKLKVRPCTEIKTNDNITISSILNLGYDSFLLGTYTEGAFVFNFSTSEIEIKFDLSNGLTNNPIMSSYKDRENNLWFGTDGSGVYKYRNNKFTYFNKSSGFNENYINIVAEDQDKNLWVALRNNGVVRINKSSFQSFTFSNKNANTISDNNIHAILPLKNKSILFGTEDGLCLFQNDKFIVLSDNNFRHKYIVSLFLDKAGIVWIGTNEGLYTLDIANGNKIKNVESVNKLNISGNQFLILFITEDADGKIWLGTEEGLLCLTDDKITFYNNENKFITNRVNNGVVDSKGNLWFGTEAGLYFYNHKTFQKIAKDYGVPSSYINFLQLHNDNLYIGTNNGIEIIKLLDVYAGQKRSRHLSKGDGLLNLESNANASAVDSKGRILIGTISGLEIYDPLLDIPNIKEALLNITEIKLFHGQEDVFKYDHDPDSNSLLPNRLILPHSKNNLTFKFVGISLTAPEKVIYKYKLEGLDEDWTPEISKNEITYQSLPPGTYTFMVKATNNDGLWNKNSTNYSFTILHPWYNTWWFYTLCFIAISGGVISYNYIKTNKLKKDKQKLERIVNDRTSELRNEKEKVEIINKEVIEQKIELENKNHEITDSIKYAKNIQEALLPALAETENAFTDCFVLYLPKDIVSGDFFWYANHNGVKYIAAADCTGHGVPGAFMSIVGNNLLNEIIIQKNIVNPGDILLELHNGVKEALHQNNQGNERRDGMDIALCAFHEGKNTIEYSGANRPLWIYRQNNEHQLEIIKPNKFAIGGLELEENRKYISHTIEVNAGDYLYIFSDGFADQFGGPRGKKFMVSNMQKLLFENLKHPMQVQKQNINSSFQSWKDSLEQIDDVLLIGIKI